MYFLTVNRIKPGADPGELRRLLPSHFQWIDRGISEGWVVQAGKWGDRGGIVILRAEDAAGARGLLMEDPLIGSGLVSYEVDVLYPHSPGS
jgi:hypothetical protein